MMRCFVWVLVLNLIGSVISWNSIIVENSRVFVRMMNLLCKNNKLIIIMIMFRLELMLVVGINVDLVYKGK